MVFCAIFLMREGDAIGVWLCFSSNVLLRWRRVFHNLFPWVCVVGLLTVLGLQFTLCDLLKFTACSALFTAKICTYVNSVYWYTSLLCKPLGWLPSLLKPVWTEARSFVCAAWPVGGDVEPVGFKRTRAALCRPCWIFQNIKWDENCLIFYHSLTLRLVCKLSWGLCVSMWSLLHLWVTHWSIPISSQTCIS